MLGAIHIDGIDYGDHIEECINVDGEGIFGATIDTLWVSDDSANISGCSTTHDSV